MLTFDYSYHKCHKLTAMLVIIKCPPGMALSIAHNHEYINQYLSNTYNYEKGHNTTFHGIAVFFL